MTYSCPAGEDVMPITSKELLLQELQKLLPQDKMFSGYVIGQEEHKNEKLHFHVYLKFNYVFETRNCRFFDILGVHPKVEKAGAKWISYCIKDGNILSDEVPLPAFAKKKPQNEAWEVAIDLATNGKINDAMLHLRKWQPKDYLTRSAVWRSTLSDIWNAERILKRPMRVFTTNWIDDIIQMDPLLVNDGEQFPRTMIFIGGQGIGKTEAAKFLLQRAGFPKVLIVNQAEDLKRLHDFDAFVFDECNVNAPDGRKEAWSHEEQIVLVDWAEDRTLPARYVNITIPASTPRILTSNNLARCINFLGVGIERRIRVCDFGEQKLYLVN